MTTINGDDDGVGTGEGTWGDDVGTGTDGSDTGTVECAGTGTDDAGTGTVEHSDMDMDERMGTDSTEDRPGNAIVRCDGDAGPTVRRAERPGVLWRPSLLQPDRLPEHP